MFSIMKSRSILNFHSNMNFTDIAIRYILVVLIGVAGGLLHSLPIMALAIPVFLTAILGYSPLFKVLGIDHGTPEG